MSLPDQMHAIQSVEFSLAFRIQKAAALVFCDSHEMPGKSTGFFKTVQSHDFTFRHKVKPFADTYTLQALGYTQLWKRLVSVFAAAPGKAYHNAGLSVPSFRHKANWLTGPS